MSQEAVRSGYMLGIDIGGTCTDVTLIDVESHQQFFFKTESVPGAIDTGVVNGIQGILSMQSRRPEDCRVFVHGATLALNAILTRSGAPVGLLVTRGFGDVLEMGRMQMPDPFNLYTQKTEPLVRKKYVFEISERIVGDGRVDTTLVEQDVVNAVDQLTGRGVRSVVVCFINSYTNPAHEQAAAAIIRKRNPDMAVSLSSDVWPEIREYERAMVSLMNAYVSPPVTTYLAALQTRLDDLGLGAPLNVTTSNGGMLPAHLVKERPGTTLLSGPAAGVIACAHLSASCNLAKLIAFDMGGTSTDLAALAGGAIPYSTETRIGDFPIIFPSVEVISVGAGGGSIARLDNMGVLKVGPQSAGAQPGPVCYGKNGTNPTVTDAYVETGILDAAKFLGGRVRLRPDLTSKTFSGMAAGTRYSAKELAEGVLRVATSNLMVGIGRVEAAKGIDIRDFALLAYGGAGPTHACMLADALGMRHVVVPLSPGTFCAWGSLLADFRYDYVQTLRQPLTGLDWSALQGWFADHEAQGQKLLSSGAPMVRDATALRSADMRYFGQGFNVEVPLTAELVAARDPARLAEAFHSRYEQIYGFADRHVPVDLVNLRLTLIGHSQKLPMRPLAARRDGPLKAAGSRAVFSGGQAAQLPVFWRSDLVAGDQFSGPCLIDQDDTTTFVTPGWTGTVDAFGIVHLRTAGQPEHIGGDDQ